MSAVRIKRNKSKGKKYDKKEHNIITILVHVYTEFRPGTGAQPEAHPIQHLKPRWPVSNAELSVSIILRKGRRP